MICYVAVTSTLVSKHSSAAPDSTSVHRPATWEPPAQSTESSLTTDKFTTVSSNGSLQTVSSDGSLTSPEIAAMVIGIAAGTAVATVLLVVLLCRYHTTGKSLLHYCASARQNCANCSAIIDSLFIHWAHIDVMTKQLRSLSFS